MKWIVKTIFCYEIEAETKQEAFEQIFSDYGHLQYEANEICEVKPGNIYVDIVEKREGKV